MTLQTRQILEILGASKFPLKLEEITNLLNLGLPSERNSRHVNALLWYLRGKDLIQRRGICSKFEYFLSPKGEALLKLTGLEPRENGRGFTSLLPSPKDRISECQKLEA